MKRVLNFGVTNWIKAYVSKIDETSFIGEHYGYKKKLGITCQRVVNVLDNKLIVKDIIKGSSKPINVKQIWNSPYKIYQKNDFTFRLRILK